MFLPSGSEVGFVTFVKSNAKALLSAKPTKMLTVCDCLRSCRGHIGCRRCVSPEATHTQAENMIFACSYGKYEVKLSQYLILPIRNPSFHSVIAVSVCVDGVAVMDTTPLSKRSTQPSHTVTHLIYFQTKILCVCLRASVCLNTVFRIH